MKPETRATVLMVLQSDPTITKLQLDAVILALDGNVLDNVVKRPEALKILRVSDRQLDYYAAKGMLIRVPGCGRRGIGFTRPSVANLALALDTKRSGYPL